MIRKVSYLALGIAIGAVCAGVAPQALSAFGQSAYAAAADTYRQLNLFGDVFEKIRNDYVEKPDESKLIEAAINGMLSSLDPHSSYMDAKAYREMQVQTKGEFGGLGIEVTEEDGLIKVVSPIDETPAAKAGILSGDVIVGIDDEPTQGLTLDQAVDKMRGAVNSTVRAQDPARRRRRSPRNTRSFATSSRFSRCARTSKTATSATSGSRSSPSRPPMACKSAMEKFHADIPADKFKGYILDLRNNPGGLLDQSIEVVNAFVDKGEIVSTRGRNPDDAQRFNARPGGDLSGGKPLVVLINGGSASASEIVAGALQDHKRATLIGTRSFGKGSVQTIMPLGQDGALRLTTARYYTPSGRSIQAKGIEPDIEILEDVPADLKGKDDTKGEASLKGHLKNGDDEKTGSQAYVPPDPKDDKQLIAAVDLLHGVKHAAVVADAERARRRLRRPTRPRTFRRRLQLRASRTRRNRTDWDKGYRRDAARDFLLGVWRRLRRGGRLLCGRRLGVHRDDGDQGSRCFPAFSTRSSESYVDKPDENKMVVAAINGMLASLDPHSTYLDAKALDDFQTTMKGEEFGGLGLEVMQEGGLVARRQPDRRYARRPRGHDVGRRHHRHRRYARARA